MEVELRPDDDAPEEKEDGLTPSNVALGCLVMLLGWLAFVWVIVKTGKWMGWL